jgi:hypothetical protein
MELCCNTEIHGKLALFTHKDCQTVAMVLLGEHLITRKKKQINYYYRNKQEMLMHGCISGTNILRSLGILSAGLLFLKMKVGFLLHIISTKP